MPSQPGGVGIAVQWPLRGSKICAASVSLLLEFARLYSPPATNTRPSASTADAKNVGALVGPPNDLGMAALSGIGWTVFQVPLP